jgi:hypothetical protein
MKATEYAPEYEAAVQVPPARYMHRFNSMKRASQRKLKFQKNDSFSDMFEIPPLTASVLTEWGRDLKGGPALRI